VWLYGKLRRFASRSGPADESVVQVPVNDGDTLVSMMERMGIARGETSNIFVNGELSALTRKVCAGDRVGIFPDDMALLYKWYFPKRS
jgi:hypothetical protein